MDNLQHQTGLSAAETPEAVVDEDDYNFVSLNTTKTEHADKSKHDRQDINKMVANICLSHYKFVLYLFIIVKLLSSPLTINQPDTAANVTQYLPPECLHFMCAPES